MTGKYLWQILIPCLVLLLTFAQATQAQEKPKTNVLIIAVDDLNMSLGCYGHGLVKTPNIDRLAKKGVRFDRAYCQYPLCNPSRTSFMSGKRPATTRVIDNTTEPRTYLGDVVFLNEYFQRHGYFTGRVGKIYHGAFASTSKWNVSEEPNRKGLKAQGDEADANEQVQKKKKDKQAGGVKISWKATQNKDEEEPDGMTARRIAELLEKNKAGPFFLAAGFHKPHLAFIAPEKYFGLYPPEKIQLPKEPEGARAKVPAQAFTKTAGDEKMTDQEKKQAIAAYYACVSFIDAQVGILLDTMDRLNLWDNTIVIFVSDHGFHLLEHGLWRKMTLFENAARVPLIVVAPGVKGGAVSPGLVELVDLYPTLTDFCRLPTPEKLEGTSLVPLLTEPDRPWKKGAFTTVGRGKLLGQTVANPRHRYTEWGGDEKLAELYDHQTDPRELINLVDSPAHADILRDMRQLLRQGWQAARPPGVK